MASEHLKIGFVRRGYSSSGGAEAYLKRLAAGLTGAGHAAHLFTTSEWPEEEWRYGPLTRLAGGSPRRFADALERHDTDAECDVLFSFERVWNCDILRAGDGVHRAWLARRSAKDSAIKKLGVALNRKHRSILRLERSLFGSRCARRVVANSQMVKNEIIEFYGYPAERIDVVYNGVPARAFRVSKSERADGRAALGLQPHDIAVLFVGSGWERKGLRFAIKAMAAAAIPNMQLIVAGRGDPAACHAPNVRFLGAVADPRALYGAADIFLLPTLYDPFSNACLEAAAAGLPVITTSANGFSEIIEDGIHGSVVTDPSDIDSLSAALRHWAQPEQRESARPSLQHLAGRFDLPRNVEQTHAILLKTRSSAR